MTEITTAQAEELLKTHRSRLWDFEKQGLLTARRVGQRKTLWRMEELTKLKRYFAIERALEREKMKLKLAR